MATINNMTLEELKRLINETVEERLNRLLGQFELDELPSEEEEDTRTWDEVKASVKRNRWTPPPGTPSVTELIRTQRNIT
jgi:regulator of protease activity HflC (stomatin/prohibitin superfamily)